MSTEVNEQKSAMNVPTQGPWTWTHFCKPNGDPILTVEDVAETIAGSAKYSERAELWGVTLADADQHEDGRATVVCYTGNGPNAHNNARAIAAVPLLVNFLRRLVRERDHGFVYSRDAKDGRELLDYLEGQAVEASGDPAPRGKA